MMKKNVRPEWKSVFRVEIVDEDKPYSDREVSGIYVIRSNKPIRRIGGIDRRGILYIGQANDLAKRLDLFHYAGHKASWFLSKQRRIAKLILGQKVKDDQHLYRLLGKLAVKAAYPVGKKSLNKAERSVVFAYLERFGELPPLNFNLPGSQGANPKKADLDWAKRGII
jgi:hypothetical protein